MEIFPRQLSSSTVRCSRAAPKTSVDDLIRSTSQMRINSYYIGIFLRAGGRLKADGGRNDGGAISRRLGNQSVFLERADMVFITPHRLIAYIDGVEGLDSLAVMVDNATISLQVRDGLTRWSYQTTLRVNQVVAGSTLPHINNGVGMIAILKYLVAHIINNHQEQRIMDIRQEWKWIRIDAAFSPLGRLQGGCR